MVHRARVLLIAALLLAGASSRASAADEQAGLDHFEKKIRPVLVERCYACHSAEAKSKGKLQAGLRLDTRAGIRAGGESGPAIVPGDVESSELIAAIRHESFEMPPKNKLPDSVIADFVRWVELGAPDPREGEIAAREELDIEAGRRWWSFQALAPSAPPVVAGNWPRTEIDRYVLARLNAAKLKPAADAEPRVLVRRLYFDLIGLPPTPEETDAFLAEAAKNREAAV